MLLSGIAFGIRNILADDGMQTKWFIMLDVTYAELSALNVVAGTALYQFKRQNL